MNKCVQDMSGVMSQNNFFFIKIISELAFSHHVPKKVIDDCCKPNNLNVSGKLKLVRERESQHESERQKMREFLFMMISFNKW